MELHKGTDRLAVTSSSYTLKLPLVDMRGFTLYAAKVTRARGVSGVIKLWHLSNPESRGSLKGHLAHGIIANRREKRLVDLGVVVPTTSILGGLINVQQTAHPLALDFRALHTAITDELDSDVAKISHMTEDLSNFGQIDGQAYFVHGGSHGLEEIMKTRSEAVRRALGALSATEHI